MTFNSLQYALFLPAVVAIHWALPGRRRVPLVLAASYVFYGAFDLRFLLLMLASTVVDYHLGMLIVRCRDDRIRRRYVTTSVAVNLVFLATFKYFDFFISSAMTALRAIGLQASEPSLRLLLPVGISFYTFQSLSYTIDLYRRRCEPAPDLMTYAAFVAYFPHLVAGPIQKAHDLLPQIAGERRPPSAEKVCSALALIARGLVLKVAVADQLAPIAERGFRDPAHAGSMALVLGVLAFAGQIYGDFSGYSDIARGSSRLLSIELGHNFRQPYLSTNIADFWHRWHISLSSWLREYLYVPLGGNRQGRVRTVRNLMTTMMLGGLWHGAGWNFIVWGALHGLYLVAGRVRQWSSVPAGTNVLSGVATFALVAFAWIFFRAASLGDAYAVVAGIVRFRGPVGPAGDMLAVLIGFSVLLGLDIADLRLKRQVLSSPARTGAAVGVALCAVVIFSGTATVPFIYFRF